MHFWLFKNGIANVYDIYTIYGHVLGRNSSSKHALVGQYKRVFLEKWHGCATFADPLWLIATIEYVALVKKLARKTSIKDKRSVTIDDDLPNLMCKVQAES